MLKRLHFWYLCMLAWGRGLRYRWPRQAPLPARHSGCSCALKGVECWPMYRFHGWKPWCFQRCRYGVARLFAIPLTPEEIAADAAMFASYLRAAEEVARELAAEENPCPKD